MAYGSIDDQSSPTNVKPQPASRGGSGRAMGDLDEASSPGFPNPDQSAGFKPKAIYDSATPTSMAQDVTTTKSMEDCCGDQIELELKMSNAEQLAHRSKAFNAGQTQNGDPIVPDFQAGEIEY